MNKLSIALAIGAGVIAITSACSVTIPKGAKAVKPFEGDRYLGKWYEIARLDFKFEKNLNNVTAQYSKGEEGNDEPQSSRLHPYYSSLRC